jgi:uncharacterized protein DUF4382
MRIRSLSFSLLASSALAALLGCPLDQLSEKPAEDAAANASRDGLSAQNGESHDDPIDSAADGSWMPSDKLGSGTAALRVLMTDAPIEADNVFVTFCGISVERGVGGSAGKAEGAGGAGGANSAGSATPEPDGRVPDDGSLKAIDVARIEAERTRAEADVARMHADEVRGAADRARIDAERARQEADIARQQADDALPLPDDAPPPPEDLEARAVRLEAEAQRLEGEADTARLEADTARGEADQARAEADRARAELDRLMAEIGSKPPTEPEVREPAPVVGADAGAPRPDPSVEPGPVLTDECQTLDLLTLRGGVTEAIGASSLPAGDYSGVRLMLEHASIVVDGEEHQLFVPSGNESGLKIDTHLSLRDGQAATLTLDFDAESSIRYVDGIGYLLSPVIRVIGITAPGEALPPSTDPSKPIDSAAGGSSGAGQGGASSTDGAPVPTETKPEGAAGAPGAGGSAGAPDASGGSGGASSGGTASK